MDPRFFNSFYGPRASRLGHKVRENIRQVTYGSDRTLKCEEVCIIIFENKFQTSP